MHSYSIPVKFEVLKSEVLKSESESRSVKFGKVREGFPVPRAGRGWG